MNRPNIYTTDYNTEKRARELAKIDEDTWSIYVFAVILGLTLACWAWAVFY